MDCADTGKLIIIKHNSTYLSVYAHNRELLVKEGERVSRGQNCRNGSDSADGIALDFEYSPSANRSTPSSSVQEGADERAGYLRLDDLGEEAYLAQHESAGEDDYASADLLSDAT